MTVHVVEDPSDDAVLVAASIWAAAVSRRDGPAAPVTAESRLDGIRGALREAGASLLLARDGGESVGFAIVLPSDAGHEIRYLATAASSWGRSIASALLAAVAERSRGATVELWVLETNRRAVGVYESAGWRLTGDAKSQLDTRRVELRMERSVPAGADPGEPPA